MTAPRSEIVHKKIQNPHAKSPLILPILVLSNTSEEDLFRNIKENSSRDLPWVAMGKVKNSKAILVGGGGSIAGEIDNIRDLQSRGGMIYAMNAASQWLRKNGIEPDFQVIADAKFETSTLVDREARGHLFASQVNPATMDSVSHPILWHLGDERIEDCFPPDKRKRGGYALIGGGASVGNSALCLAYVRGHRELHVFGYDSCHWQNESHAYLQPMNKFIPTIEVEWAGREFTSSVAMKAQAEKFQITAQMLKAAGCGIKVYGDGLLQHMFTAPTESLTERDKYRLIWQSDSYRETSPGEEIVSEVMKFAKKPGPVIDFGCGTGRASLRLSEAGYDVVLVDFADNCRDEEAQALPFVEWDLTRHCPLRAPYGLCADMMEHIPRKDIDAVLKNIMESAGNVFFQISTVPDSFGSMIRQTLHLTVENHKWWLETFARLNLTVRWHQEQASASQFIVERT